MIFSLMHFAYMMHPFIGLSLYLNAEILLSFQDRGKDFEKRVKFLATLQNRLGRR